MIQDHGEALEFDLRHELGIDLYEYLRGDRPMAQLYRFITRLPRHGHFQASIAASENASKRLVNKKDTPKSFGMLDWTYERELLTTVCDLLQQLHASFIQANSDGGKRPKVEPMPRPKTALDRLEARQVVEEHRSLVRLMLPE